MSPTPVPDGRPSKVKLNELVEVAKTFEIFGTDGTLKKRNNPVWEEIRQKLGTDAKPITVFFTLKRYLDELKKTLPGRGNIGGHFDINNNDKGDCKKRTLTAEGKEFEKNSDVNGNTHEAFKDINFSSDGRLQTPRFFGSPRNRNDFAFPRKPIDNFSKIEINNNLYHERDDENNPNILNCTDQGVHSRYSRSPVLKFPESFIPCEKFRTVTGIDESTPIHHERNIKEDVDGSGLGFRGITLQSKRHPSIRLRESRVKLDFCIEDEEKSVSDLCENKTDPTILNQSKRSTLPSPHSSNNHSTPSAPLVTNAPEPNTKPKIQVEDTSEDSDDTDPEPEIIQSNDAAAESDEDCRSLGENSHVGPFTHADFSSENASTPRQKKFILDCKFLNKYWKPGATSFSGPRGEWGTAFTEYFKAINPYCPLSFDWVTIQSCTRKKNSRRVNMQARCKFESCMSFKFAIYEDLIYDKDVTVICEEYGDLCHKEHHAERRFIAGGYRKEMGENIGRELPTIYAQRKLAEAPPEIKKTGNLNQIPSATSARKIRQEHRARNDLAKDEYEFLRLLKKQFDSREDLKSRLVSGFIQSYSFDPFHVIMYGVDQIKLTVKSSRSQNLFAFFDATGTIVKKPKHAKQKPYYYALLLPGDEDHSAIPIAEFISCHHDAMTIQIFFNRVKVALKKMANSTESIIDKLEQDFSLAGLHAASLAFNGKDLHQYIEERYKAFVDPTITFKLYTTLHICSSHCYHNWVKKIRECTNDQFTQLLLAAASILLMHATSLEEARQAYRDFIIVFGLDWETTMFESSLQRIVAVKEEVHLMPKINPEKREVGDYPQDLDSQAFKVTSPFAQFFRGEYDSILEEASRTSDYSKPNPYKTQSYIQYLSDEYLPYYNLWSGIDLKKFNLRRDSNATAENWFRLLKYDEFKMEEKISIPRFIQGLEGVIKRRLVSRNESALTTQQKRNRRKKLIETKEKSPEKTENDVTDLDLTEEYWNRSRKGKNKKKMGLGGIMKKLPKYINAELNKKIPKGNLMENNVHQMSSETQKEREQSGEEHDFDIVYPHPHHDSTTFPRDLSPNHQDAVLNASKSILEAKDDKPMKNESMEGHESPWRVSPIDHVDLTGTDDESSEIAQKMTIDKRLLPSRPTVASLNLQDLLSSENSDQKPWRHLTDYPENWQEGEKLSVGGITVDRGKNNFSSLSENAWINDSIINAFVSIMWLLYPEGPAVLDSYFTEAVVAGKSFMQSFLRVGLESQLWTKQSWVIPVNTKNAHWSLLLMNFFEKKMIYLDSARSAPDRNLINCICHYTEILFELAGVTRPYWRNWQLQRPTDIPYQYDGNGTSGNCGIHCCIWVYIIFSSARISFHESEMTQVRQWLVTLFIRLDKCLPISAVSLQAQKARTMGFDTDESERHMRKLLQRKPKALKWDVRIETLGESTLYNCISLKAVMNASEAAAIETNQRFTRQRQTH